MLVAHCSTLFLSVWGICSLDWSTPSSAKCSNSSSHIARNTVDICSHSDCQTLRSSTYTCTYNSVHLFCYNESFMTISLMYTCTVQLDTNAYQLSGVHKCNWTKLKLVHYMYNTGVLNIDSNTLWTRFLASFEYIVNVISSTESYGLLSFMISSKTLCNRK